jgi:orotate phosphoribosyltransferase
MDVAREIASAGLSNGGIKLNVSRPHQWASGYFMPIYNDNRVLLASSINRTFVTIGLVKLMTSNNLSPDILIGTSTAGIAPAASLSQHLSLPMAFIQDEKAYVFENLELPEIRDNIEAIAATTPWSIPIGVQTANAKNLPFMYVRKDSKSHGLKKAIEGKPKKGQKVLLIDYYMGESYSDIALQHLEKAGTKVLGIDSRDISSNTKPQDLSGLQALVIEDLISTGGSSVAEVYRARQKGAKVDYCLSIFSYGLDKAADVFSGRAPFDKKGKQKLDTPCNFASVLTYDKLLELATQWSFIKSDQLQSLQEWRQDPFGWGERHGFPRMEKYIYIYINRRNFNFS